MDNVTKLDLDLSPAEAMALAQFVKRLSWSGMRENAISDAEAYEMKAAIDKLQIALRDEGYAPR